MDNLLAMQCKNCGNNEYARFKKRGCDFICNCCGSWYRSKDTEDPHCENGYAMLTTYHFEEAKHIFQTALTERPDNIDALWGWLLAEYRIIYVKGFYLWADRHLRICRTGEKYGKNNMIGGLSLGA